MIWVFVWIIVAYLLVINYMWRIRPETRRHLGAVAFWDDFGWSLLSSLLWPVWLALDGLVAFWRGIR